MAKDFDPTKNLRGLQNFTSLVFLYGSIVAIFAYSIALLMSFTLNGVKGVLTLLFTAPVGNNVAFAKKIVIHYWLWWWKNKTKLGITGQNFITLKIFGSTLLPTLTLSFLAWRFRKFIAEFRPLKKPETIYGDAHWANEKEIKKAGLRAKKGVLMGKNKKGYLIAEGYEHTLLFAPTGSGKGTGFVIPNLLFWTESVICHDIKLENYTLTSGWRNTKLKQKIFVWEPSNPEGISHCYNPIDWVSAKPGQMVDDVQKFANLVLQKKEFWENEARTLLVGVILYLLADSSKVKSFGEVVRTLRGNDFAYAMAVVLDTLGRTVHPVCYMNLAAFLQKADKERSGVVSTLNSGLELWANPLIDATTARSDFDVQQFKRVPTSVYVGLTPDNIQRLKSLMNMFYQQSTDFMSKKLPTKGEPYGVLMLMDEFPTLGKMEQFMAGIAYFRGYHVRLFLIVQDTQQLKGTYEESGMNSFLSNSKFRVTFAANNQETAKLISELCGNRTVEQNSYNAPRFLDLNPGSRSMSKAQTQRALLLPQEVIALDREKQIILIEASPPIMTEKIRYFKDKDFTKKLLKKVPLPKQEAVIVAPQMPGGDTSNPPSSDNNNGGGDEVKALPAADSNSTADTNPAG